MSLTSGALCCYTAGLCFLAIRDTLVKVFYAYKETKIPTTTSILAIMLNIGLNLLLSKIWGINGLAIATSFSAVFQCFILYFLLRKKIGDFGMKHQINSLIRIVLASIGMLVFVKLAEKVFSNLGFGDYIRLFICTICGIIIYTCFVLILRIPIAHKFYNIINKRLVLSKKSQ